LIDSYDKSNKLQPPKPENPPTNKLGAPKTKVQKTEEVHAHKI
jgi:hypothetical protein